MFRVSLLLTASLTLCSSTFAKGAQPIDQGLLDSASQEALRKTQEGLTNPDARLKMLEGDAKGQEQDAKVRSMLGDQSEGAYQISSQVLETIVNQTKGDPTKMQELVNQMLKNPQMLEQYLSAQQRDQIRKMASEIEAKKGSAPVSGSR